MFKLVKLFSNNPGFHSVEFHDGLNVILGKRTKASNKTTNGVGKSLLVKLIDFCLGSDRIEEFCEPLNGWIFNLDVKIHGIDHHISRSVDNQTKILFDDQEFGYKKFREKLSETIEQSDDFSFRQLITKFLRRGKYAYTSFDKFVEKEQEADVSAILIYLLGLDYKYCLRKKANKVRINELKEFKKTYKRNSAIKDVLEINDDNIDIEISNLEYEIEEKERLLNETKFAENYEDIKSKATTLSQELNALENEKFYLEKRRDSILQGLEKTNSVSLADVRNLYEKANIAWNNELAHSLKEIESFHDQLFQKRKTELNKELLIVEDNLSVFSKNLIKKQQEYNELISFLKTHSDIDKYYEQLKYIDSLKDKRKELLRIQNLEKDFDNKIIELNKEKNNEDANAQAYIESVNKTIKELNKIFITLAKKLYPDKTSGLSIQNNTGDNQIRFDIYPKITSDGSDGIKEMIIFCFDLMLLKRRVTSLGFIFHDSLLVSDVDVRQKETLFNIIKEEIGDLQYIININDDQIESFSEITKKYIEVLGRLSWKEGNLKRMRKRKFTSP